MLMHTIEYSSNMNLLSPSAKRKFPKVGYGKYCCLPTQNPLIALFLTALRAGIFFPISGRRCPELRDGSWLIKVNPCNFTDLC